MPAFEKIVLVTRKTRLQQLAGETIAIESLMPSGGVIFSDGVEADALDFNSGAIAAIGAAAQRTQLVVGTA
jgi:hypothetical protein